VRIGILGSGRMAAALAPHWVHAGHEVLIGGRSADRAAALASKIGSRAGTLREAAEFGAACLLAVRSEGLVPTLEAAGGPDGTLASKAVVDCGNAVHLADFSQVRWDGRSLAEHAEFLAVGARVVKAFNLCHADVWRLDPPQFDGRRLAVPYCGADAAKAVARTLIEDVGGRPVDVGDLSQARHLEAMAIPVIRLLVGGAGPHTVFNLITDDRAADFAGTPAP
jgi:8-hydroxy-5-deazaflavin:NADPH oxidoreductase